ncbi:hypothetical protein SSX86_010535 [Deinandra increscens subsp. villosa]|uniref:Integrase catalytic domain-containing protein n=1 Tax=Deinandra increscens subsp. villosa TaxID=3103831 RepID=A0AAP0D7Q2_9ASTR
MSSNPDSTSSNTISNSSPLYLHPSDHPGLILVSNQFNGSGFGTWKRSMTIALSAKNKLGFVDGTIVAPTDESEIEAWKRCNHMVISWILNTLSPHISQSVLYTDTAQQLWTELVERYGQSNRAQIYQLQKSLCQISQGSDDIATYFTKIKHIWDELISLDTAIVCTCTAAQTFKKKNEDKKLVQFLMGLNPTYDTVRGNILMMSPFPSINQAYALLIHDEKQREIHSTPQFFPDSSLNVNNVASQSLGFTKPDAKKNVVCTNCKKAGHTVNKCYRLIGFPKDFKFTKTKKFANNAQLDDSDNDKQSSLSADQFQTLLQMLQHSSVSSSTDKDTSSPASNQGLSFANFAGIMACNSQTMMTNWIIDTGASDHMCSNEHYFSQIKPLTKPIHISLPNSQVIKVTSYGNVSLNPQLTLSNVLYVPEFKHNLLSVPRLCKDTQGVVFFSHVACFLQGPSMKRPLELGRLLNGLYLLHSDSNSVFSQSVLCNSVITSDIWHCRLGHLPMSKLHSMFPAMSINKEHHCVICPKAKQHCLSFPKSHIKTVKIFDLIHVDTWGPYNTATYDGHRSDNALELGSSHFMTSFFQEHGIVHQTSCVGTPQQNGVVERKHKHLLETCRALLFQSKLPLIFWGDCLLTATYLVNLFPTEVLAHKSPYEVLYGKVPSFTHLRSFGCLCYVSTSKNGRDKLQSRANPAVFLGYPFGTKGYKVYDLVTHKFLISRNLIFHETIFPSIPSSSHVTIFPSIPISSALFDDPTPIFSSTPNNSNSTPVSSPHSNTSPVTPSQLHTPSSSSPNSSFTSSNPSPSPNPPVVPVRRSTRASNPPSYLNDYQCHNAHSSPIPTYSNDVLHACLATTTLSFDSLPSHSKVFLASLHMVTEPTSYKEAATMPEWQEAMNKEFEALTVTNTWDVVDLPAGKKPIRCKWVYKVKYNADGTIERALVCVATKMNWEMHQLDINNAFLHGDLDEEIYMHFPPGMAADSSSKVLKLKKSLYGLKQASRQWYGKLSTALKSRGYVRSPNDYSLFSKTMGNSVVHLAVYVDDILLTGNNSAEILALKNYLNDTFKIKDLGFLNYFLGIELIKVSNGLIMSQRAFAHSLLKEFDALSLSPVSCPLPPALSLKHDDGILLPDPLVYRKLVGKLNYLTHTRPDLAFTVQYLSQFMQHPRQPHLDAAFHTLKYVKGSIDQGLFFNSDPDLSLLAYCDSDWAACPITRRSLSGYFISLGGCPISWKSKKQPTISLSSAEAEYRSMRRVTAEIGWLTRLLAELQVPNIVPVPLKCDNQAAIHIAKNPVFHERTKHIEIDCHFVRDKVQDGLITLIHTPTQSQLADVFTKSLPKAYHQFHVSKLDILKHQFCLIPSKFSMVRRVVEIDDVCPFYSCCSETIDHLLIQCARASEVWSVVFYWCNVPKELAFTLHDILHIHEAWPHSSGLKKVLHGVFVATLWGLWKARNRKVFNDRNADVAVILWETKSLSFLWITSRIKRCLVD